MFTFYYSFCFVEIGVMSYHERVMVWCSSLRTFILLFVLYIIGYNLMELRTRLVSLTDFYLRIASPIVLFVINIVSTLCFYRSLTNRQLLGCSLYILFNIKHLINFIIFQNDCSWEVQQSTLFVHYRYYKWFIPW